ncbi:hypothetical protein QFC19_001009 [Naganishia cerealis]|uniref:Uncharacterized protein n=1 Tax=Naganishia cerealis TaxID=610337 RepID=A0ACC2WJ34_9TREE|nr:hypothetical protein QFC19_001009 [Naganishia cerealis]
MVNPSTPQTQEKDSKRSKGKGKVTKEPENQKSGSSTEQGFSLFKVDSAKDAELDDLFSKSASFAVPPPAPKPTSLSVDSNPVNTPTSTNAASTPSKISKRKRDDEEPSVKEISTRKDKKGKKAKKDLPAKVKSDSLPLEEPKEEAPSTSAVESAVPQALDSKVGEDDVQMENLESDEEENEFVHESMRTDVGENGKRKKQKKTKFVPEGESKSDRDRRTIFIGNLPVETVKSKPLQRKLYAHIRSFVPDASIESIRFRSIAFATPTSHIPEDAEEADGEEANRREQREKERAAAWRAEQEQEDAAGLGRGAAKRGGQVPVKADEETLRSQGKVFFQPGEKRKVAFIKREFHEQATSINAYMVFGHPAPDRSKNVRPIQDPYEAAEQAVRLGNHSTFEARILRLDASRPVLSTLTAEASKEGRSELPIRRAAWLGGKDPKMSLFVGNMDYNTDQQDIWIFFEKLVEAEKGAPKDGQQWVVDVRIIRDKDTQMGKGFGYIAFSDAECVDEILALPAEKLKYAKRTLRVQRCKVLPPALGGKEAKKQAAIAASSGPRSRDGKTVSRPAPSFKPKAAPIPIVVPKGDPTLGAKLVNLSKDERKVAKSSDPERLARRMAKKQVVKAKAKAGDALAGSKEKVKLDMKSGGKKGKDGGKLKAKKSRVRSEHALKKMKESGTRARIDALHAHSRDCTKSESQQIVTSRSDPLNGLLHLPDDVRTYLTTLRDALLGALSVQEVLQIYLIGSASYTSGYISGQSDLDVAVVTRSRLEKSALARVPEFCSHSALPCPADKLELVVYAYEDVHLDHPALPYNISLNYNTGRSLPRDHERYGNNPDDSPHWFILDIAAAHANNLALLDGPAFADIFTPRLGRRQVLDALQTSLQWHIEHEPTSANAVLNACRGWRWAVQGVFGSKLEGGKYALSRLSGEAEHVVQTAIDMRTGAGDKDGSGDVETLYVFIASELQEALDADASL